MPTSDTGIGRSDGSVDPGAVADGDTAIDRTTLEWTTADTLSAGYSDGEGDGEGDNVTISSMEFTKAELTIAWNENFQKNVTNTSDGIITLKTFNNKLTI
jgi:hypothetical protein